MAGEKLTQQTGKTSGFADDDLMHVVDVSFNPPGTSFKVKLLNLWKWFVTKISGTNTSIDNTTGLITIEDYTSLQLEQSQPESPTIALSSDASPNHCVIIERDGGAAFTGLTVTSYSNPKDGAIAHVKVSSRIQGAFVILGTWVGGSGSDIEPSIFYSRYDQTGSAWIPIARIPITMLELSLQSAYNGGNTINTSTLLIDATKNLIGLTIASDLSAVGDYVVALGNGAASGNTGGNVVALGQAAAAANEGSDVVALGRGAAQGNTKSNIFTISPYSIPTFADKAAADAEITTGNGYVPGLYIYWNTDTSDVGGVLIPV